MDNPEYLEFRCLQVVQPIGMFYVGILDFNHVISISYADVRRIEQREVEVVLGIQRPLSSQRVSDIQKYVKTVDATFPTSVILAIDEFDESGLPNVVYDAGSGVMKIRKDMKVAKVIDGQHRIAGLLNYNGPQFQMNVTIFVDMDPEDQAMVFATINLTQTKVNKSLVYDLYDFALARSPQKTCHNIAKLLNSEKKSPLVGRIKILGVATGKPYEFITQAAVVERLMAYVSRDPMVDRDQLKRRRKLSKINKTEERVLGLIFRNMFLDERDEDIALVLWNYFGAVAKRWPQAWGTAEAGYILNRSTGFVALMRFLKPAYLSLTDPGGIPKQNEFESVFVRVQLEQDAFTKERFVPGSSGESDLFKAFMEESGLPSEH